MRDDKNRTWLNYLNNLNVESTQLEKRKMLGFDGFFGSDVMMNPFFRSHMPYTYILDYTQSRYITMAENFAGYKSECFLKLGLDHTLEIIHPQHLNLFNKEIFPERLTILKGMAPDQHNNYVFSYTLQVKNSEGGFSKFLQRNCFISDDFGNPLYSMGMLIDITDHHFDNRIIQTVQRLDQPANQYFERKVFYLNKEDKLLSKREIEILLLTSAGLSNKQIGEKLYISEKTVKAHKSNMQDKTGCPNGFALVRYACKTGLI
ncbi:LuxR C-terminal-related transcriptional regulator [Pedobacter sp. L105]|uniref:LuxR C-terminal-related transcriptional regulator n=1 Tax=Pedobacter sp. L105 TaxID=1641871 RepID=UPI00131D002B|nr:LuxR C-terminal-related transcriptional regulator [Pedobacter sp. L105]